MFSFLNIGYLDLFNFQLLHFLPPKLMFSILFSGFFLAFTYFHFKCFYSNISIGWNINLHLSEKKSKYLKRLIFDPDFMTPMERLYRKRIVSYKLYIDSISRNRLFAYEPLKEFTNRFVARFIGTFES